MAQASVWRDERGTEDVKWLIKVTSKLLTKSNNLVAFYFVDFLSRRKYSLYVSKSLRFSHSKRKQQTLNVKFSLCKFLEETADHCSVVSSFTALWINHCPSQKQLNHFPVKLPSLAVQEHGFYLYLYIAKWLLGAFSNILLFFNVR